MKDAELEDINLFYSLILTAKTRCTMDVNVVQNSNHNDNNTNI